MSATASAVIYKLCTSGYCIWTRDRTGNWTAASHCDGTCECYDPDGMKSNGLVSTASATPKVKVYYQTGTTTEFAINDAKMFDSITKYHAHHCAARLEFWRSGSRNDAAAPTDATHYQADDQYRTDCYDPT